MRGRTLVPVGKGVTGFMDHDSRIRNQVTGFMDTGSMNLVTRLFRGGGLDYLRAMWEYKPKAPLAWNTHV